MSEMDHTADQQEYHAQICMLELDYTRVLRQGPGQMGLYLWCSCSFQNHFEHVPSFLVRCAGCGTVYQVDNHVTTMPLRPARGDPHG